MVELKWGVEAAHLFHRPRDSSPHRLLAATSMGTSLRYSPDVLQYLGPLFALSPDESD